MHSSSDGGGAGKSEAEGGANVPTFPLYLRKLVAPGPFRDGAGGGPWWNRRRCAGCVLVCPQISQKPRRASQEMARPGIFGKGGGSACGQVGAGAGLWLFVSASAMSRPFRRLRRERQQVLHVDHAPTDALGAFKRSRWASCHHLAFARCVTTGRRGRPATCFRTVHCCLRLLHRVAATRLAEV